MKNAIHRLSVILTAGVFISASLSISSYAQEQSAPPKIVAGQQANYPNMPGADPAEVAKDKQEADAPGLDAKKKEIEDAIKNMQAMQIEVVDNGFASVIKGGQQYSDNQANCVTRQNWAANACLETISPNITDVVTTLNTLASTLGSSAVNDSCSMFAKAMDIAKKGMTAYTTACGAMKAGCGYSCVQARKGVEMVQKGLSSKPFCQPKFPACNLAGYQAYQKIAADGVKAELETNSNMSVAGKAAVCTGKYAQLLVSAVAGIGSIVNSMKQGQQCDDKTKDDGNTDKQVAAAEKCADPKNAQLPDCICLKNPMLEGCGSTAVKASDGSSAGLQTLSTTGDGTSSTNGLTGNDLTGGSTGTGIDQANKDAASSGVGAPVGGGGGSSGLGGGGGGSGNGRDPAAEDKTAKAGLNTNILAGAGGGGGGGGAWGAGGGSGEGSGYRNYLPGGAKDPNKLAGQQNWTKEVTGQGGKSNWEKVKERYRDNKATLLGN